MKRPAVWLWGILLMSLFFLAGGTGCRPGYAQKVCAWENKIAALDLLKQDDLVALNAALTAGSVLDYCKVIEKLLPLTYEELQDLVLNTNKNPALNNLHNLLERVLTRAKDKSFLIENIFINNVPQTNDSPFYDDVLSGRFITDMKPYAEQVYVNNLKLTYQKNSFVRQEDDLWLGPRALKQKTAAWLGTMHDQDEMFSWAAGQRMKPAFRSWSWQLQDDYRHDFFLGVRQYMKHYEECSVQPVIYKNTVILRNAYRIFCLSLTNAEELWSIGPDNNGQEFYHTFRHPHQNSYGYDLLFLNGIVFSELGGRLAAVDVTDICRPYLKWARGLGEYTLCTKPAVVGNKLICGLVNARGEVWFCGFDVQAGTLIWSRYIGLSSFLAPVCTLEAITGDKVVIGTNHGVLACLAPDSGEIIWLKKYTPRRYRAIDYWWKGYYKDVFLDTGSLPYNTQFLEQTDNGLIYYKPRESNYLYTIDTGSGKTIQQLYVDPAFLYVLGVYDGKVVFLQKEVFPREGTRIMVTDMRTGVQLSTVIIDGDRFKGVLHLRASQIIFKIDETLYVLDLKDNLVPLRKIPLHEPGWLLGASEQAVLIGENKIVKCLGFNSGIGLKNIFLRNQVAVYLDGRERVKNEFRRMDKTYKINGQASRLLAGVRQAGFSVNEIFSIVQNSLGYMREPAGQGFLKGLNNIYGRGVITYRDIQMTLSSFLTGSGLLPQVSYQKPAVLNSDTNLSVAQSGYRVKTGFADLLPVNIIRGANPANFFILLNTGQIVCVGEKGGIRWERKIFSGPLWQSDTEEDRDWHLYSNDIEIYLYDNVLIINDRVNVIAVDVNTGVYIWSMTNKREALNDESQLPSFMSRWSYEARLYFVKQIMMRVQFLDDVLILSHKNMLYALDPKTGYCKVSRSSGIACAMDMRTADGRLYVASHIPEARIKVFDKNLEEVGDFSSSSIGENKNAWPQLVILPNYVLLQIRTSIHIFDKKDGRLRHSMGVGDLKRYYIEPHNDGFIIIAPFLKTCGYRVKDGIPQKEWEYPLEPQDQRLVWDLPNLRTAYYLMTKDCVLNFMRRQDDYWIIALDLSTGKRLWQVKLDGIQGRFYSLSNSIQSQGRLQFIMTCVYTSENYTSDLGLASRLSSSVGLISADLDSVLFCLDTLKGSLIRAQRLPSCGLFDFPGINITQTGEFFQYIVNRALTRCVRKENQ